MNAPRTVLKGIGQTALFVVFTSLFGVGGTDLFDRTAAVPVSGATIASAAEIGGRPNSFAGLVDVTRPAVVNISTTQVVQGRGADSFREFFERYLEGGLPPPELRHSLGSGVIVEPDGYVLTNHHVIENAEIIIVRLSHDEEYPAKVVGRDPWTDLALLKIQSIRKFTAARLSDSDSLRVGDWVVAIGNPFGLHHTVTAGIVSAKGRVIGAGPYDDFIQTDAAINPGNSGGPLFNSRGGVVGINTAVFSQSGGSVGIGFAIPINLAKELIPELKATGRVSRGWLGITIAPLTPDLAKKLNHPARTGALVAEVVPNGPAARSGVQVGDVIVAFQGKPIRRPDELPRLTSKTPVGSKVELTLLRGGSARAVSVRISELPEFRRDDRSEARRKDGSARSGFFENYGFFILILLLFLGFHLFHFRGHRGHGRGDDNDRDRKSVGYGHRH